MVLNLTAIRGDNLNLYMHFTQDGADVNITGWILFFTLKANEDDLDTSAILKKEVTSHTDPTHGITVISASPTETNSLLGNYFYDVQYKTSSGEIITPYEGVITFSRDITRRTTV